MIDELRTKVLSLTAMIALATAGSAVAGTFSISPIRVELSGQQRTEALTVRNEESDKQVVVQAQVFAWSQQDGEDVLSETHDVIVTPPVFTLAPNSQQIVRVASRRAPDAKRELSYRLILQEVPPEAPKNFTGLQVALRLSLPIFIASQNRSAPELVWGAAWQADNSLQIAAKNQGDAHAQIIDFTVHAKSVDVALRNSVVKYVLPGATTSWTLQAPTDAQQLNALKQTTLMLRGSSDRGEIAVELTAAGR
jgi:fimbrial chaperone protein